MCLRYNLSFKNGPVSTAPARDSSVESRIKTQSAPPERIKIPTQLYAVLFFELFIGNTY